VRPYEGDETPAILRFWADQIDVKLAGDIIAIRGTNTGKDFPKDFSAVFKEYLYAPKSNREAKGPHLEFANAKTDAQLLQFIKKWGPITAPSFVDHTGMRRAKESLKSVPAVREVLAAALSLLTISRDNSLDRDRAFRAIGQFVQAVSLGGDIFATGLRVDCEAIHNRALHNRKRSIVTLAEIRELCEELLCELVNRFPPTLVPTSHGVLTAPFRDHGVLPLLIFMLGQDLVSGRNVIVCERCGDYFLQRRLGERGCSSCKEALRSKRYYEKKQRKILRKRKAKRAKRLAAQGLAPASIATRLRTDTRTVRRLLGK
jgi:hypothetical protein